MKAIIYAGIGLFSVAMVYGLADYYSSQKNGTLKKLYVEEEPVAAPVVEENNNTVMPAVMVETAASETKAVTVKARSNKKVKKPASKEIKMEDFSRARIPEPVAKEFAEAPIEKKEEVKPDKPAVESSEKPEAIEAADRKISLDKFSRAPLKKPVKKTAKVAQKG